MGVRLARYKLAAFAISCALAGIAGGTQAMFVSYVTMGDTFSIVVPLNGGADERAGRHAPLAGARGRRRVSHRSAVRLHGWGLRHRGPRGGGLTVLIIVILFPARRPAPGVRRETPPDPPAQPARMVAAGVPRRSGHPQRGRPGPRARSCSEVRSVSKAFRGLQALDGVDLQVRRGEIPRTGGAQRFSKSTMINVVSGHYVADMGQEWCSPAAT